MSSLDNIRSPTRSGFVEQHALRLFSANAGNVPVRAQREAHVVGNVQRLYSLGNDVVEEVAVLKNITYLHPLQQACAKMN